MSKLVFWETAKLFNGMWIISTKISQHKNWNKTTNIWVWGWQNLDIHLFYMEGWVGQRGLLEIYTCIYCSQKCMEPNGKHLNTFYNKVKSSTL